MSDLPVSHYLEIYEHRLSMSERGITHPTPQVVAGVRRLVAALRTLKPEEKIALDATSERAIFRKSMSGELIAQIDFDEPKMPNQTPEPTTLLVTTRADARLAPSRVVAHL